VTVADPVPAAGFVKPPTAQEAVLAELRRAIGTGDLRPGEQVRQDSLAQRYGVSRVPLREALKILEGEGQVEYRPHRGYFVAELNVADLLEVYRIRDLLESEAVRVATPNLSAQDLAAMTAAAADVDAAAQRGDVMAMTEANRRFHFQLIDAAAMPRLARLTRILWDATDAYRSVYFRSSQHRAHIHDEHVAVVDALRTGDAERAVVVLREHRERAIASLVEQLGGPVTQ
jgi:DNA-binding GntR family transcriptional regulator